MKHRIQYPLTAEAKETARQLVEAWSNNKLDQAFTIVEFVGGDIVMGTELYSHYSHSNFDAPLRSILSELAKYNLVSMTQVSESRWEVLLLQELRNAVEKDFVVSDFFLTTSAIGTVVYGNLEVREGAILQSVASIYGDVAQNIEKIAEELTTILGEEILHSHADLREAIEALKTSDEKTRFQKMGGVIEELGRSMAHGANASTIIATIKTIAQFLGWSRRNFDFKHSHSLQIHS